MQRRPAIFIAISFVASVMAVVILFFVSNNNNKKENGFVRLFPPHMVGFYSKIDLQYNSYYIAGLTKHQIFLGNTIASTEITVSSYALMDTQRIALRVPKQGKVAWGAIIAHIDSPRVVLTEGIVPTILSGGFDTTIHVKGNLSAGHFSKSIPISESSFILRMYDTTLKQNILVKYPDINSQSISDRYILEKQLDGIFCTDGILTYNDSSHYIVYVYYYRNQFIKLDSNLHVLYKGRTIDTISTAQIKVHTDSATMQSRMAAPPVYVNKRATVSGKWLFINSGLVASNEDMTAFNESSVIDVYGIDDGKYRFSFYLPAHMRTRLTSFAASNEYLVCVYDHYLLCFKINF